MNTRGYDNVVASGNIDRDQVINLYMPLSALTATEFATVTNMGTNVNSMADTVGSKTKTFIDYLEYLLGDAGVTPDVVAAAIAGVTAPVKNATAVTTVTETSEYTGVVEWSPALNAGNFSAATAYTATITLSLKNGVTLDGVTADYFTIAGGTATNAAGSNVITVVFPATAA